LRFAMEYSEIEDQRCNDDNCEENPDMKWGAQHVGTV
jgi:hypothetical protein